MKAAEVKTLYDIFINAYSWDISRTIHPAFNFADWDAVFRYDDIEFLRRGEFLTDDGRYHITITSGIGSKLP